MIFLCLYYLCYDIEQQVNDISLSLLSCLIFISLTVSANTSLTFLLFFAEDSTKGQPHICARAIPSTVGTSLCDSRSTLFPTNNTGTLSDPFTLTIWSLMVLMSRKVWWLVTLYTTTKPCPFFIYKSRMEANCSVPAVSKISSTQGMLSTSISFL